MNETVKRPITNLKEGIQATNELSLFLVTRLKDGIGFDDITASIDKFKNDEEFKNIMKNAVDGWREIIPEAKDVDMNEVMELTTLQVGYLPKWFAAFGKSVVVDPNSVGIVDTKEAVLALNEVGIFLVSRLKDGVGLDDAFATFDKFKNDAAFKEIVSKAVDNWKNIPAEVKDLDALEISELISLQVGYVPKWIASFKK